MSRARDDDAQAETLVSPSEPRGPERAENTRLAEGVAIGRYRLIKRLGAGAMGVVWAAHDPQLDRTVAIKVVHPALARAPEASSRLMREARALAKVSHRSVVIVHDAGAVGDHLFIAMELVEGTNLGTVLRERDAEQLADWPRWLAMMLEAGRGLDAAHRAGVLHRDFKPDNVLVDRTGRVCVGDFGLATLADRSTRSFESARFVASTHGVDLTTTGALVGTPLYMSPQALRSEEIDARADQFSFCVATWEALYGTRPFITDKEGFDAIDDLAVRIEKGELPPPPEDSTVPRDVRAHLARGLSADPSARWSDMAALLHTLEAALRDAVGPPEVTRAGRRRLWFGAALAALGAGALVVTLVTRESSTSQPGPPTPGPVTTTPAPIAKKLFALTLRTGVAMSDDGRYLALYSDRLQVQDTESGAQWSALLPWITEVSHLEIDSEGVVFGTRNRANIRSWKFRTGGEPETVRQLPGFGHWFGKLATGDLFMTDRNQLALYAPDGAILRSWPFDPTVDQVVISPSRRRFAYIEPGRFYGRIVWADVDQDGYKFSEPLTSPTALEFLDDNTMLYGLGTIEQPRIYRAPLTANGVGPRTEIYGIDAGWFGPMRAHGKRLFVVQMQPKPRTSLLFREGGEFRKRELDNASVALGWSGPGEFLAWNRITRQIERRTPEAPVAIMPAALDGEPANATTIGPVIIAALRRQAGREVVAVSSTTGNTLWRHPDGRTLLVRCAGDSAPPCFAVRVRGANQSFDAADELVTLDPHTGELGKVPIYKGAMEDIAVSPDGKKILFVGQLSRIVEITSAGVKLREMSVATGNLRSVAYDPLGGFLLGGTYQRNNYVILRVDAAGTPRILAESDDDILSLIRPSTDGSHVVYLARSFAPDLWQLDFPKPLTEIE